MKASVSSVLAERIRERKNDTPMKFIVRKVKFSPEEIAYEPPADVSHLKLRRAVPAVVVLDPEVAKVFKTSAAVDQKFKQKW